MILLLAGLLALAAPAAARAQSGQETIPGRRETLSGRVVKGADRAGVAGAAVELHRVTAEGGSVIDSAVSAADGSFRFTLPDENGSPLFLAAARHEGALYFGPPVHAGRMLQDPYEVTVYDTAVVTAPPSDLRVGVRRVVVTPGIEGGLEVAEMVDVVGPQDRTIVAGPDTLALWSTALPDGATAPRVLEGGAPPGAVAFLDGRVRLRSMISPVGVRVAYTYSVADDALELAIEQPTDRLEILVAGANAEVRGAAHAETSGRDGRVVHRYEGVGLAAGETLEVALVSARAGTDRWAIAWAALGAALLLAAVVVWRTGLRGTSRPS